MEIYPGDLVRVKLASDSPQLMKPSSKDWIRVTHKGEHGWYAVPTKKKNPLLMTIIDLSYHFKESEVIDHQTSWLPRLIHLWSKLK